MGDAVKEKRIGCYQDQRGIQAVQAQEQKEEKEKKMILICTNIH